MRSVRARKSLRLLANSAIARSCGEITGLIAARSASGRAAPKSVPAPLDGEVPPRMPSVPAQPFHKRTFPVLPCGGALGRSGRHTDELAPCPCGLPQRAPTRPPDAADSPGSLELSGTCGPQRGVNCPHEEDRNPGIPRARPGAARCAQARIPRHAPSAVAWKIRTRRWTGAMGVRAQGPAGLADGARP